MGLHSQGMVMVGKRAATGTMKRDRELALDPPAFSKIVHLLHRVPYQDTAKAKKNCLHDKYHP